jgi:hypothetical protein
MKTISFIETNRSGRKNADHFEHHYHPIHCGSPNTAEPTMRCQSRVTFAPQAASAAILGK